MKTNHILALAAFLALVAVPAGARAEDKHDHGAATAAAAKDKKAKPYPLDHCLVSDEKFEGSDMKPFEMVHEGQTIKFCCKNCVKDFKKDPKKYLAKLEAESKKQKTAK